MYSYSISLNITQNHFHFFIFWHLVWLYSGFPSGLDTKESACHSGELGSISGGSVVKNLPAKRETWVWFLGQKDPLEKEMVTHSRILSWEIPWTEDPGGLTVHGVTKILTWLSDWTATTMQKHVHMYFILKAKFFPSLY